MERNGKERKGKLAMDFGGWFLLDGSLTFVGGASRREFGKVGRIHDDDLGNGMRRRRYGLLS